MTIEQLKQVIANTKCKGCDGAGQIIWASQLCPDCQGTGARYVWALKQCRYKEEILDADGQVGINCECDCHYCDGNEDYAPTCALCKRGYQLASTEVMCWNIAKELLYVHESAPYECEIQGFVIDIDNKAWL